jgi:hypothetical protein
MKTQRSTLSLNVLTSLLALSLVASPAAAQTAPSSANAANVAPPAGQYAPPPAGAEAAGSTYDDRAQRDDRDYADRYGQWAARYCVDRRNNTAAGALIGGVLGAVAGSGLAGRGEHAVGALAGGAVGATAGAAIGASANPDTACPPGYAVAAGAPAFYYDAAYPPTVVYGPAWYQPWVWVDGRWVYRPYRYWYWTHGTYWRPDWRPRPWAYHYHRW